MKTKSIVLLCSLLALWSAARGDEKKPAENKLDVLARFVGEWTVDGKWEGGEELHARAVYAWGLNKQILSAKTFVKNGDSEYQRYEGIMAWHPRKKCIFQVSFAYDGAMTETVVESANQDTLHIGFTPFTENEPSPVRQVLQFKGKDQFQWTVSLNMNGEWKKLISATWQRKKS